MKLYIFAIALMLSGCSILVPVKRNFPDAVPALTEKCEDLRQIEGNKVTITDMLKTVVENYSLYYQCSNKVDGWNDWYQQQKKIFNEVK